MRDWNKEKTASDPDTEREELEMLAGDWDWHVRRAVALNSSAPLEILRGLAKDKVQWVREAVAASPLADGDILDLLSQDGAGFVRAAVALNHSTSPDTLLDLSWDEMMDFDYTLSKNRYITQEAVAKNPNSPEEVIRTLSEHGDEHVRAAAVSNSKVPGDVLFRRRIDISWVVRTSVARSPQASVEILAFLAQDRIQDVRAAVATNPRTSADSLKGLAADRDVKIRVKVAQNQSTDLDTLEVLSLDWAWKVRERVAQNPSTPEEIVRALAEDGDHSVKKAARDRLGLHFDPTSKYSADY